MESPAAMPPVLQGDARRENSSPVGVMTLSERPSPIVNKITKFLNPKLLRFFRKIITMLFTKGDLARKKGQPGGAPRRLRRPFPSYVLSLEKTFFCGRGFHEVRVWRKSATISRGVMSGRMSRSERLMKSSAVSMSSLSSGWCRAGSSGSKVRILKRSGLSTM